MSSRQIRLLTSSDADLAAKHSILAFDEPNLTLEKFKYYNNLWDPKYKKSSFLVEVDGIPVAVGTYAEWIWWYEPGRYELSIKVHSNHRRQGHGSALYEILRERLASETPPGKILMCKCREDEPDSVRFVQKRGFPQSGRDQASELAVADFDKERFDAAAKRMSEQGIEIVTYAELAKVDPECHRHLYDLNWITIQDKPSTGTYTRQPFERFVKQEFGNPRFMPEGYFVALHNGRYVGECDIIDEQHDGENLETGYTGVHPDYRRRGIATALKLRCIQFAQEHGFKKIITDNDATNPMYQLNLQLGYKPTPGYLLFEMKLE